MRGSSYWVSATLCLVAAAVGRSQSGVNRANDTFRGEKDAFVLWPNEPISGPVVSWAQWAPSGKRVLGCRVESRLTEQSVKMELLGMPIEFPAPQQVSMFVWETDTRKSTDVLHGAVVPGLDALQWIGVSDTALVTTLDDSPNPPGDHFTQTLYWVDTAKSKAGVVTQAVSNPHVMAYVGVESSPAVPFALVFGSMGTPGVSALKDPSRREVIIMVRPGGKVGAMIQLPQGPIAYQPSYSPETHKVYLSGLMPRTPEGQKQLPKWFLLDDVREIVTPCDAPAHVQSMEDRSYRSSATQLVVGGSATGATAEAPDKAPPTAVPVLDLMLRSESLGKPPFTRKVKTAWLEAPGAPLKKGRPTNALVSADCTDATLSPTLDGVIFIAGGSLFCRNIQRIDLDDFERAADLAERQALMSNGKQVALGLIMYAMDNDDNLPGGNLPDDLNAYLKDPSLTDGFVYTFTGGNMSQVESPATTELGHIDGNGGRAVVYVDGHVQWVKN